MLNNDPHNYSGSGIYDLYKGFDFIFNTFSNEASEGGKDITPKEISQIFDIFTSWFEQ